MEAATSRRNDGNGYLSHVSVAQHSISASPLCFYKDLSGLSHRRHCLDRFDIPLQSRRLLSSVSNSIEAFGYPIGTEDLEFIIISCFIVLFYYFLVFVYKDSSIRAIKNTEALYSPVLQSKFRLPRSFAFILVVDRVRHTYFPVSSSFNAFYAFLLKLSLITLSSTLCDAFIRIYHRLEIIATVRRPSINIDQETPTFYITLSQLQHLPSTPL